MTQTLTLSPSTRTGAPRTKSRDNTRTATSLAARDPWAVIPSLGDLQAYIGAVNRLPMLSAAEESQLGHRLHKDGDLEAASKLVLSHLRLVVSTARQYVGYGLPHADLIQEGNVGLMKAVRRFDPAQGTRLVSYALHWIKAEIHEYILRNWRLVKVATTKAQRKLFFNLRSMKTQLAAQAADAGEDVSAFASLSPQQVQTVAQTLDVKPREVIEMEVRLAGGDVSLEPSEADNEGMVAPISYLTDDTYEPTRVLEGQARDAQASTGIDAALHLLDARSRDIVVSRWLHVDDDHSGATLHELAAKYGVSAERIRQIEAAAMKKMRTALGAR